MNLRKRRLKVGKQLSGLVQAVMSSDEQKIEEYLLNLSRQKRYLAILAFVVGAVLMLLEGVKLLFTSWKLLLVQILPAMWIWAAMIDLKAHVIHGKSFYLTNADYFFLLLLGLIVIALTMISFFLNAVFGFAISKPGTPDIRPAFKLALKHKKIVFGSGAFVGILLALSTLLVPKWGLGWFALSLGAVIGLMMICYVAIPSRLIGVKSTYSKRDKLAATAVGGLLGAVVCTPPYLIGRVGILLLGSKTLFIVGVILLVIGFVLEAGTTSAVKTVKMSSKLIAGVDKTTN